MFTLQQIKEAHSKVKSGKDFPKYVQDILELGLTGYSTFVSDGHSVYSGANDFRLQSAPVYPALEIAGRGDKEKLQYNLQIHQQGQTDYLTFCKQAAESGVEKWTVATDEMTCTYYDKSGNALLLEKIPMPRQ